MRTMAIALVLLTAVACGTTQQTTTTTRDTNVYGTNTTMEAPGTLVRCESVNNGRQTCEVDERGRMVYVNQQLSNSPCVVGRTWGVSGDRDEIWVDGGCRAEFQVGSSAGMAAAAFGKSVVCESHNNGKDRCAADTSYGVQLVRQISRGGCERGKDWGFDENGIWVDNGCRGEFVLGGEPRYTPMTSSAPMMVTCESQNDATAHCAADTYYGVTLARQISNSLCVRGQTWGYDASGIWVTRGCRAEFVIGQ